MTDELTFTGKLLSGLAQVLHDAGAGTYSADTVGDLEDVAITIVVLPPAPQQVITLTPYPVAAYPGRTDVVIGINVRIRGDMEPLTVIGHEDRVYAAFHGLRGPIGSGDNELHLSQIYWQSAANLGPAEGGELQRSVNYYAQLDRPDPHP